jgi:hypothetical protein
VSCEEQRILKNPAEQECLNERLAAANGYKRCPSCRAMIEKTEGCNYMTCRCGAHICWRCMNVFQTPQDTYEHLRTVHEGIYDEAPAGVVVGRAWNAGFLDLARIERERVAREQVFRRPMAAVANPFVDQYQNPDYRAQLMAEQLRRARAAVEEQVRALDADIEDRRRRALGHAAAEERARHIRAREALEERVLRAREEQARRARTWEMEYRAEAQRLREAAQRREESGGGQLDVVESACIWRYNQCSA